MKSFKLSAAIALFAALSGYSNAQGLSDSQFEELVTDVFGTNSSLPDSPMALFQCLGFDGYAACVEDLGFDCQPDDKQCNCDASGEIFDKCFTEDKIAAAGGDCENIAKNREEYKKMAEEACNGASDDPNVNIPGSSQLAADSGASRSASFTALSALVAGIAFFLN